MKVNINKIKWLKITKEKDNSSLFFELHLNDGAYVLKIDVDSYTSNHFLEAFKQTPFKEKNISSYDYWFGGYSVNKDEKKYCHTIIIMWGKKRHNFKSQCSKNFCQNIKWLLEINDRNEIEKYIIK